MAVYSLRTNVWLTGAGILVLILILASIASPSHSPGALISQASHSLRHDPLDTIRNSTLGFQKIFVVSLPSRTDHRDAMSLSAALTGLHVDYIDGVTEVSPKAIPPGNAENHLNKAELGSWRAHMNVALHMVENNIASALVLEDDVDWDIRIKDQMQDFARASRMLVQPRLGTTNKYLDPTRPQPRPEDEHTDFYVDNQVKTMKPQSSPYGDLENWDMLWVGHCGCYFPLASRVKRPLGRAVLLNDQTVAEPQHLGMMYGDGSLEKEYPPHTRVVSHAYQNMCIFAYALSLPGAQRLLYEFGVRNLTEAADVAWRQFCQEDDRPQRNCLTVQPTLFQDHRPVGKTAKFSDIGFHGDGVNEEAFTRNIRWSTRLNMAKLLEGETDYIDLYQDGAEAKDRGWG